MLSVMELHEWAVRPALAAIGLASPAAEALLLGTAVTESGLRTIVQSGGGPARGIFQMEPATHDDIHANFLDYRRDLRRRVLMLAAPHPRRADQLVTNLLYAAAMCRVHYRRVPTRLPAPADATGMARYWKDHYNTPRGAGRAADFEALFRHHVRPLFAETGVS